MSILCIVHHDFSISFQRDTIQIHPSAGPTGKGFQFVYRDALCTVRTCKNIVDAKRRIAEITFKMTLRTTYTSATGQETNQECTYHHRE